MPPTLEHLLRHRATAFAARILLTFPFWASGAAKLIDFPAGTAEMAHFGLAPATAYNAATILVQLGGSLLVILDRGTWLGAGALGVFTALTIPIVHRFWAMTEEPFRTIAFHTATEHLGMIGGLVAVAVLSTRRTSRPDRANSARGIDPGEEAGYRNVARDITRKRHENRDLST